MTEIQVLSCKSLKGLRVVWPMKVHFRKLLTLLRAVQLFVMCSFLLGFFQLESGKWSWSLVESNDLLTPWMGHRERQRHRALAAGLACCSRFYGCEVLAMGWELEISLNPSVDRQNQAQFFLTLLGPRL